MTLQIREFIVASATHSPLLLSVVQDISTPRTFSQAFAAAFSPHPARYSHYYFPRQDQANRRPRQARVQRQQLVGQGQSQSLSHPPARTPLRQWPCEEPLHRPSSCCSPVRHRAVTITQYSPRMDTLRSLARWSLVDGSPRVKQRPSVPNAMQCNMLRGVYIPSTMSPLSTRFTSFPLTVLRPLVRLYIDHEQAIPLTCVLVLHPVDGLSDCPLGT